jgi:hypothetical protein
VSSNKSGVDVMAGTFELEYKGKKILCLDLCGIQVKDKEEFKMHVGNAKKAIAQHPPKSLLLLMNVANTAFDTEIAAVVADYATHNTPYVKASAIVGISGVQKMILTMIKSVTGRDFYLANTMQEAQDWLAEQ